MLNIPSTITTSILSKYQRTGSVEHFDAKWQEKELYNRGRNTSNCLAKSNRQLTLQNITAKLNQRKTKTFCQKTVQRVLHSEGYKRRLAKTNIVVREANRKKRVKWCKGEGVEQ